MLLTKGPGLADLQYTLDEGFCINGLRQTLPDCGVPDISITDSENTAQGGQFARDAFAGVMKARDIAISMDKRGRPLEKVFGKQLWLRLTMQ